MDISRIAVAAHTGTERYTYELLAALAELDQQNRYTLYCNQPPAALPPLSPNFKLRHIPFPRLWTQARLSADLLLKAPETLFIPAHVLPLGAPLRRRMHTVVTIHDMGYLRFPEAHPLGQRLYLRLSTRWSARAASRLIAISRATRDDMVRFLGIAPEKIDVIHHGLSPRFQPIQDQSAIAAAQAKYSIRSPYFLYVGTIQPRKNLVRLIEAFATMSAHSWTADAPAPQLVIAGKRGWLTEDIERQAARLFGSDSQAVHFAGFVDDADLPALLSGARAFVLPSLYEGFGMPVLEAMACGTPVLCSNTSALPEVAGDAALLADPEDTTALAAALARLASDDALRDDLRARGMARAAQFTWQRCAEQTLRVLLG